MRKLLRLPRILHGTLLRAARHDCLNLAQSTAYSAMVSLFPALIVAAAVVSGLPDTAPLRFQLSLFFDRILPPDVSPLLQGYFVDSPHSIRSTHALIVAFVVSLIGASSVLATLMEGVRRANELPENCWTFWQRRLRALLLVPLSLVPFALATTLVVFGQFFTGWGVKLDANCVGEFCKPDALIHVYLDGKAYAGDPSEIPLTNHLEIAIIIGQPPAEIPFTWTFFDP